MKKIKINLRFQSVLKSDFENLTVTEAESLEYYTFNKNYEFETIAN